MDTREMPKSRFLAAFFLTLFIFLLIIVTNNYFNETKLNSISSTYNDARIDTLDAEMQYNILAENPCLALNFGPLTEELFELGSRLTEMEENMGKENKQVINLKKYYSILEVRSWLFLKKAAKDCKIDATGILFFYSNKNDCDSCEKQGFVLNYIRKSSPNVYVYSFDTNLGLSAISTLKLTYNITEVPSIVINDRKYEDFKDADEIFGLLKAPDKHE